MTYKIEENNNTSIVHLNGEIDMEVADKARQTILPLIKDCLLYTSPSPRDLDLSRMPSSA